jgi:hypothetical protein
LLLRNRSVRRSSGQRLHGTINLHVTHRRSSVQLNAQLQRHDTKILKSELLHAIV